MLQKTGNGTLNWAKTLGWREESNWAVSGPNSSFAWSDSTLMMAFSGELPTKKKPETTKEKWHLEENMLFDIDKNI